MLTAADMSAIRIAVRDIVSDELSVFVEAFRQILEEDRASRPAALSGELPVAPRRAKAGPRQRRVGT